MSEHTAAHLNFSQRNGYEKLPPQMRLEELSGDLRREIYDRIWRYLEQNSDTYYLDYVGQNFTRLVLKKFFKIPEEKISDVKEEAYGDFRKIVMDGKFNKVLDLVEIIANADFNKNTAEANQLSPVALRDLFDNHVAAYSLQAVNEKYQFHPRTSKQESDATLQSLEAIKKEHGFEAALSHLDQAAEHIHEKHYSDAIHDSISAVESVARTINREANTLGKALKQLEGSGMVEHPAFLAAIKKLYGYTSDEAGIRHPLIDGAEANVGLPEALFFYNACAAFCGYLATIGNVK